jgi:hypothetical protein
VEVGLQRHRGAYGLCIPGNGHCQCLDNGRTAAPPCHAEETADLYSTGSTRLRQLEFDVVRRTRVSVAYKEELPF